ncbi:MAG: FHA domain-containing protein [Pyrinomonadaceae bacterium]
MSDKTADKKASVADWFMQGALARIGETVDKFTGRRWEPAGSLATSGLIERLKKLLDAEAREVAGKGNVVPHHVTLKMQWDKFSTDADDSLAMLKTELLVAATDHINDKLYYTFAPLTLDVKTDYFTEGVKLYASFDEYSSSEEEVEMNVTIPVFKVEIPAVEPAALDAPRRDLLARRSTVNGIEEIGLAIPSSGRITIGRTAANDLVLDDPSVSKVHASLVVAPGGVITVADTGSTNGTFIKGERMSYGKALPIASGETVRFGEVEVSFILISVNDAEVESDPNDGAGDEVEFSGKNTEAELSVEVEREETASPTVDKL